MRRFWRVLMGTPYGRDLLAPSVTRWIATARVTALFSATIFAFAWGYAASWVFGPSRLQWIVLGGIALLGFSIVFSIEIWILSADFSTHRGPGKRSLWQVFGVLSINVVCILVTGPLLCQAIFATEISREIQIANDHAREAGRSRITRSYQAPLDSLEARLDLIQSQLISEAAGTAGTGLFGEGPVFRTLAQRLDQTRVETQRVMAVRDRELAQYEQADAETLRSKYGVETESPGLLSRLRYWERLQQRSEYKLIQVFVIALLFLIQSSLVVLKLFAPNSVVAYYSADLQRAFRRYLAGYYDAYLPPAEKSTPTTRMSPSRFEGWYSGVGYLLDHGKQPDVVARDLRRVEEGMQAIFHDEIAQALNQPTKAH